MKTLLLISALIIIYVMGIFITYIATRKRINRIMDENDYIMKNSIALYNCLTVLSFIGFLILYAIIFFEVTFKYLIKKFSL